MTRLALGMKASFALGMGAALGGLVHLVRVGVSLPALVLVVAGFVAAGLVIGSQVTLHLSARPQWRGAAERGVSGWSELRRELDRSRRAGRSMALIRIAASHAASREARAVPATAADAAQDLLRSSDSVWLDGGALYVLLPESSSDGAVLVKERLVSQLSLGNVRATTSAFPEDGWTSEVLLAKLHGYQVSGVAFEELDELKRRQRRQQVLRAEKAQTTGRTRDREAS